MKTISEKVFVKTSELNRSSSSYFIFWSGCVFFGFFLLLGIILVIYYTVSQGLIIDFNKNSEIKKDLTIDTKSRSGNSSIFDKKILNESNVDQDSNARPSLVSHTGKFET